MNLFLLVGIGLSCIVANIPGSGLVEEGGLFHYAYQGVESLILPPLIFLGVGAMTDFGPMIANPSLVILGAAAHLGIFVALIMAKLMGFSLAEACSHRYYRRCRRSYGNLYHSPACTASSAADFRCRILVYGINAAYSAASNAAFNY